MKLHPTILYGGLIASLILYILTSHTLFAIAVFGFLLLVFYHEFTSSPGNQWRELAINALLALALWSAISFALNTTTPINIVTSCSMLPNLERGDLIILAGGINAPEASYPGSLANVTYSPTLVNSQYPLLFPAVNGQQLFVPEIGQCELDKAGKASQTLCLKSISFQGKNYTANMQNDILVYDSKIAPGISAPPAGLIIHRAFLKINAADGAYYLTKGDNNPFLDQQSGFQLAKASEPQHILLNVPFVGALTDKGFYSEGDLQTKGKVLLRVPYIGYLKLFLFLQFEAPPGCDTLLKSS